MAKIGEVLKHAWNVFSNQEQRSQAQPFGQSGGYYGKSRPDRVRFTFGDRSIISSIYARLSIDVASVDIRHVRLDDQHRYLDDIDSGLNNCLTVEANIDQAARAFRQDIALSLFNNGVAAIVPVDTSISPEQTGGFDILTLRVGEITEWYPEKVKINLYNQAKSIREEIVLPKSAVAIIENPLYSVMNESNSTLQRLLRKLSLMDTIDESSVTKKLDLIIQLPYVLKSEARQQQAEQRRKDIEFQLASSEYGVAYTDATEKVIQLNRPVENNLMGQVEFLTKMLYAQLGLTDEVMNGTADEKAMLNYWNRTIEPILTAIVEEFRRKFLTKTARTQKQWVEFFKNSFSLVPIEKIAEIADVFARNEIATSNEIRQVIGWKPHPDPKADQLVNSNMPGGNTDAVAVDTQSTPAPGADVADMASSFDQIDAAINDAFDLVGSSNGNGGGS